VAPDSRVLMSTNPDAIETHGKYVLSCMRAKGYFPLPNLNSYFD